MYNDEIITGRTVIAITISESTASYSSFPLRRPAAVCGVGAFLFFGFTRSFFGSMISPPVLLFSIEMAHHTTNLYSFPLTNVHSYPKCKIEMMGAQVRIANTLEQFYDESTPIGPSGQRYKDAVTKMESQVVNEVVCSYLLLLDTLGICQSNKDLTDIIFQETSLTFHSQ